MFITITQPLIQPCNTRNLISK